MKKIMAFLFILLFPVPVCAMKSIADSELSSISGPASLSISFEQTLSIDTGPLAWGNFYYLNRVFSASENHSAVTPGEGNGKTTEEEEEGGQVFLLVLNSQEANIYKTLQTPRLSLKGKGMSYSDTDEFDSGYANGLPSLEIGNGDLDGYSFSDTSPKFYDIRTAGDIQLRMYYTGGYNCTVLPKSTVDVWVH